MGGSPCSAAGWLPPGTPDLSRSAADERPGGEERRVRGAAPLSRAPCTPASATAAPQPPARVETAGTATIRPSSSLPRPESEEDDSTVVKPARTHGPRRQTELRTPRHRPAVVQPWLHN